MFRSHDIEALETNINKWIEKVNPSSSSDGFDPDKRISSEKPMSKIEIIDIKYASHFASAGNISCSVFSAMVIYRE